MSRAMSVPPTRKSADSVRVRHGRDAHLDLSTPTPSDVVAKSPLLHDPLRSGSILGDVTFMRLPEVKAVTGLGKTSIYELIRERSFPAPVRLGPRAVAWVRTEIRQWALERVRASRSAA